MKKFGLLFTILILLTSTFCTAGCSAVLVTRDGENPDKGLQAGCGGPILTGSGNLKTEARDFSGFTEVEAQGGFQVELTQSDTYRVEITTDDNIIDYIEVYQSGDKLTIKPQGQGTYVYRSVTFRAEVTMPDFHRVELSGGSRANITGFNSSHDLLISLSGGSSIAGDITAGNADIELSGGSRVNLEGTANDLVISGSGGSQLDLDSFPVNNADIHLSGGGSATVNVSGILNVDLSGDSRVIYVGESILAEISLSGDSTVSKKYGGG